MGSIFTVLGVLISFQKVLKHPQICGIYPPPQFMFYGISKNLTFLISQKRMHTREKTIKDINIIFSVDNPCYWLCAIRLFIKLVLSIQKYCLQGKFSKFKKNY